MRREADSIIAPINIVAVTNCRKLLGMAIGIKVTNNEQQQKREHTRFVVLRQTTLASMICPAMFGNGVKIGTTIIVPNLRPTQQVLRRVLRAFSVVARGSTSPTTAACPTAAASILITGTAATVCASPCRARRSPVKKT